MQTSRRRFVQGCAATTAAHLLGARQTPAQTVRANAFPTSRVPDAALRVDPALVKQLALSAVDAATRAGANYADVRLTRTLHQRVGGGVTDDERLGVGVRCLVNGAWGFAASAVWRPEEMPALARSAAAMAAINARVSKRRRVAEWTPMPAVTGDWTMPVEIDPFTVSIEEKIDCLQACAQYADPSDGLSWHFDRREHALATTEGTYVTQTTYYTRGAMSTRVYQSGGMGGFVIDAPFHGAMPGGRGWELLRDARYLEQQAEWRAMRAELKTVAFRDVELGRYDVVADGWTVAALVDATLGRATELDRALGYEANASGTSYLGPDPLALLGTFRTASPLVTLTADRSMPGGTATVRWDDEGVVPTTASLVTDGILTDYQTTREQAAWLAPYYQKAGKPIRSHGYAGSETALGITMQQTPNLTLAAGKTPVPLEEMIAGTKKGLVLRWGEASSDFQAKTGSFGATYCREIVNGKLGAVVLGANCLFTTTDLWKSAAAIGGVAEAQTVDANQLQENGEWPRKGQPPQGMAYSVCGVPATFTNVTVTR